MSVKDREQKGTIQIAFSFCAAGTFIVPYVLFG